ncbi:MAG: MFS transporter [Gammaproteobacteria bacterium]|nr:MFS transporter [Gammaproteobacteria bacterium]
MSHSQFSLLKERRFLPFFITQALGALNDNVFKNALVIIIAFKASNKIALDPKILVNVAAVLFILPFFLFSATAGQISDKFEKSRTIRYVKLAEILIMALAVIGLYFDHIYWLLFVLFLMGFQSTLFGPIKYGLLPQHLHTEELTGGNALVETGTFLAILIGTILGGMLVALDDVGIIALSFVLLSLAVLGYFSSRAIPDTPAVAPDIKINWNPVTESVKNISFIAHHKALFLAVLGISWFWFYGSVFLSQIPNYTKGTLAGDESVATLFLTCFSAGIGFGCIICERLSAGRVEAGLVPIGAFGLSFFGYDIYMANTATGLEPIYSWQAFLDIAGSWRVLIDIFLIGAFAGLYTVPLYALIQKIGDKTHMSRIFAGLNIINALFMVISGIYAIALLKLDFSIPEIFLATAIVNIFVAIYIFTKSPEYIFRAITWLLVNSIYRIKKTNLDIIPKHGAFVLVCNHVSFVDALILAGYCKRNIRFVMDHRIFKTPIIGTFFKMSNAIPIAPAHEDKELMERAFDKISEELENGKVVCIFPEGKLTPDGKINEFKKGIEKIIERNPVPVFPLALKGLWGSWFSRKGGKAMSGWPTHLFAKIHLKAGEAIDPKKVTAKSLQKKVQAIKDSCC